MFRLIKLLALFFLVVLPAMAIAIANRHKVDLILDPFAPQSPALTLSLPLFVYLFIALIAGLLLGGAATWISQGKWRKSSRELTAEAKRWQLEANQLRRQIEATENLQLPAAASNR